MLHHAIQRSKGGNGSSADRHFACQIVGLIASAQDCGQRERTPNLLCAALLSENAGCIYFKFESLSFT